jgi:hypothetical protein
MTRALGTDEAVGPFSQREHMLRRQRLRFLDRDRAIAILHRR